MTAPRPCALPDDLQLCCPATDQPLREESGAFVSADGTRRYPILGGVPILIADERSLFTISAIRPVTAAAPTATTRLRRLIKGLVPSSSLNIGAADRFVRLAEIISSVTPSSERPRVLILGGGIVGVGMEGLLARRDIDFVETDVYLGPRTMLACDAHNLPFPGEHFDAVVCQATLEHVLDPPGVVAEIHRVLRPAGVVYSEVPFMQQVHEGAYDFTRYTHLGHRRLFRYFAEIDSGVMCGPGMALAWALRYFAMSWVTSATARSAVDLLVTALTFWLKYFDTRLSRRPGSYDAASGTFFIGIRRETPVEDGDVIASYRGALARAPDR